MRLFSMAALSRSFKKVKVGLSSKVMITDGTNVEHIWMGDRKLEGDTFPRYPTGSTISPRRESADPAGPSPLTSPQSNGPIPRPSWEPTTRLPAAPTDGLFRSQRENLSAFSPAQVPRLALSVPGDDHCLSTFHHFEQLRKLGFRLVDVDLHHGSRLANSVS